jgi:hypothetical protein
MCSFLEETYFTDLMEQQPYGRANSHIAAQEIPCLLLDVKVHYHIHKSSYFRIVNYVKKKNFL